ncbi:uncharacterized protein LOC130978961 [Arachis stenosperma]|uniref:uncharacterized protein LOC130978961 n=1 Tax=Arachis stenosperma TaxID=217475 RepID=UPI0025ACDA20|nr:uncharacterized protein LOC130978961 [Arachis stenosperma]
MEQGASVEKPSELPEDTLPPPMAPDNQVPSHEQKMELKPLPPHLKHLNQATRKDHYPLPFIDQMLDHLSVDPAKIDVISGLPYPSFVRKVRSFLGHASFYHRFIKDFSKIALPLSRLLQKDIEFELSVDC